MNFIPMIRFSLRTSDLVGAALPMAENILMKILSAIQTEAGTLQHLIIQSLRQATVIGNILKEKNI